ncbi:MAG: hypothetical protein WCC14_03735 [Acidobacteriaceae bacterium]
MFRGSGLSEHSILIFRNVGAAGITEVKNARDVGPGPRAVEIARDQTANVLGKRDAQLASSLLRQALGFRFERDLRT